GCRCMITTTDASRSAGGGASTSLNARSEPAEPTSATTLSSAAVPPSCAVVVTVDEDLTDHAGVALGGFRDPGGPRCAVGGAGGRGGGGVAGERETPAHRARQVGALLERTKRSLERRVERLGLRDEQALRPERVPDPAPEPQLLARRLPQRPAAGRAAVGGE